MSFYSINSGLNQELIELKDIFSGKVGTTERIFHKHMSQYSFLSSFYYLILLNTKWNYLELPKAADWVTLSLSVTESSELQ